MIIILYILGGILLFLLLLLLALLFIPLKSHISGEYRENNARARMEIFWIKYVLGARFRIADLEHLHVRIWFLGIPVPLRLPLTHKKQVPETGEAEKPPEPRFVREEEAKKETPPIHKRLNRLEQTKGKLLSLWQEYQGYLRKIYVRYITFSFGSLSARIGLKEPSDTGMAAAVYYNLMIIRRISELSIQWDFERPRLDLALKAKITMKLYGIFFTLLQVYMKYKKEAKP